MKLAAWIFIGTQAENTAMPCSGTTSDECQGNACQWNAATNRCTFGTFSMESAQAALSSAMGGMEKTSTSGAVAASSAQRMMASSQDFRGAQLFAPPSQSSSDLSPSMMRTLQTAGSGLASSSGDLRALDLSSWMFTSNNFLSQSMSPGGLFGNSMTQSYFQCPLDVPFCARQACSGGDDFNAYNCYSQPGCCFDQDLFLYRQMFGSDFYKSVPVCYQAVDNPLFSQLSDRIIQQDGYFNPAFIRPIVGKVLSFISQPTTYQLLKNFMKCVPDNQYQRLNLVNQLSLNHPSNKKMIDSILYGLFGESALDQFFDLLSPSCGWSEMNEHECVMSGCCWTAGKCSKSLDPMALTSDQVTAALKYVQYKAMYSNGNGARQGWLTGSFGNSLGGLMGGSFNGVNHNQAMNNAMLSGQNINSLIGLQMMNNPGASLADYSQLQSLSGSQDSYQQNVQDQLVANAMGLNTENMWMMENNNGAGYIQPSASDFSSGAVTSGLPLTSEPIESGSQTAGNGNFFMNDLFKYQLLTGQTGGDTSRGLFGGNLFSGSDSDSTCASPEQSQNCSPPLAAGLMDWMKLAEEKEVCKAKGCCWDQKRQDMNAVGLSGFGCPWNFGMSPYKNMYLQFSFLPRIENSFRGCCKMSACVHHDTTSRTTGFVPYAIPVQTAPIPTPEKPKVHFPSDNTPMVGRPVGRPVNDIFNIWG